MSRAANSGTTSCGTVFEFNSAGKANTASEKLVEGKTVTGTAQISDKKVAIEVEPRVEFYMSERDLR